MAPPTTPPPGSIVIHPVYGRRRCGVVVRGTGTVPGGPRGRPGRRRESLPQLGAERLFVFLGVGGCSGLGFMFRVLGLSGWM